MISPFVNKVILRVNFETLPNKTDDLTNLLDRPTKDLQTTLDLPSTIILELSVRSKINRT